MNDNKDISKPFNRRDYISDDGKLTKLGAILLTMLLCYMAQKGVDLFFERVNAN